MIDLYYITIFNFISINIIYYLLFVNYKNNIKLKKKILIINELNNVNNNLIQNIKLLIISKMF